MTLPVRILEGSALRMLRTLPAGSVHCIVTSPPYFALRDYGTGTWIGGDPACDHKPDTRHQVQGATSIRAGRSNVDAQRSDVHHRRGGPPSASSTLRGNGHVGGGPKLQALPELAPSCCPRCGATRVDEQIGLESTPDAYIAAMVEVFRELWRVLRDDGTCWLNIGDTYAGGGNGGGGSFAKDLIRGARVDADKNVAMRQGVRGVGGGAKPKDLLMIPARLALALQADGWWVRSEIIWHKPAPMPESCTDRPTSAHEKVYLLTKSGSTQFWVNRDGGGTREPPEPIYRWRHRVTREERETPPPGWIDDGSDDDDGPDDGEAGATSARKEWSRFNLWVGHDYFYDADAIREPFADARQGRDGGTAAPERGRGGRTDGLTKPSGIDPSANGGRNARNVWTIGAEPYRGAHFATMPSALAERCIQAGTSQHGACAACGAPFARITRKGAPLAAQRAASGGDAEGEYHGRSTKGHDAAGVQNASDVKRRILAGMLERVLAGWSPTCDCLAPEPVPCVVLDPFGGTGTTALAARRLGCHAILVELNPESVGLAQARLGSDCGLPHRGKPLDDRSAPLFAAADGGGA